MAEKILSLHSSGEKSCIKNCQTADFSLSKEVISNPSKKRIASVFSSHKETYDREAHLQKKVALRLAEQFKDLPEGVLVELGCGTGFLTEQILKRYPERELLGIDLSKKMVEHCQEKFPNAQFMQGDAEYISSLNQCAAMFSSMTLQWFSDPKKAIQRLMKETSRFFFAFPNNRSYPEWELFPLNPLPNPETLFERVSFIEEIEFQTTYAHPLEFLLEMKKIGVSAPTRKIPKMDHLKQLIKEFKCGKMSPMTITTRITVGCCHV